ncbi:uncharacterized protein DUF3515 [Actinocrispum wychmicini]|uniref:Uncharacterized protein DUF3515 n=1 Tax=Actinocrispum wychmicini TaxID=1213861 RepID=A0A4R2JFM5_9PSEU|nr:uncharacterized protein DUF3515 [Actinocrispum wychmicini]
MLVAAVAAVLLIVGVIIVSLVFGSRGRDRASPTPPDPTRTGPVALGPVIAPAAGSPECGTLLTKLPATLQSGSTVLAKVPLREPAPPATAAWADQRADPVVLRCGLDRPAELTPTTTLRAVSGVSWLPVDGTDSTTWYLADRTVYVAVTIPATAGTGPLQDLSDLIGKTLPKK